MTDFTWVILAAGGSTRLGEPKQLLSLGGQTLIEHQVSTLLDTGLPVCVVIGAVDLEAPLSSFADRTLAQHLQSTKFVGLKSDLQPDLHNQLTIIHNPDWEKGMGTSVALAQKHLAQQHIGWVLVDQYAISTEQALAFYEHWQANPTQVLVSQYQQDPAGPWGVPVITHNQLMAQATLPQRGLKPWLLANQHLIPLHFFVWPEAKADLDTPAQWQAVKHQERWHDHA